MAITESMYVGIDVAKDKYDIGVLGMKGVTQRLNTKRGIVQVVRAMLKLAPQMIVVEATGGYEETGVGVVSGRFASCIGQSTTGETIDFLHM